ncbi:putative TIM-barrel fold metal-dependent hydrolase [Sphingomonas insulae]|uniref:Amidohydrolase n=1 Tax=Sphingomonas insulae TaxID=424800 RepID=A0ABN1HU23_9SPHN|nr:amidohydrolase family protein [Sphingomonas insulae]NIJ28236.1 putative TIM-barrel fold metal-dependent hydrolase [Sphingomonas insulae]
MTTIPFVDAHVHLWDLDHIRYPWLTGPFDGTGPNGSAEGIARDYGVADYRAELARWNVVGAVHIDAGADATQALRETEWLEAQAGTHGLPTAIVAFAALDARDVDAALAAQAAHDRVRGIRQIVNWHADAQRTYTARDLTIDAAWQAGFARLADHGLSFDLQCYPGQMPGLVPLFERHPAVPVIVNHLGMPVMSDPDGLADWRRGMAALAALPHVAVKLSGLGFVWRDWTVERVRPLLLETIDLFGTDRCLFASDAPTDRLFAPIDRYMEAYHAVTADVAEDERRALFGRNADRIYRLGLGV